MSSVEVSTPSQIRSRAISSAALRAIFFLCIFASVPVVAVLERLNGALQNSIAPEGVMSFELARTVDRQNQILASWGPAARLRLAFSIGLDFFCVIAFLGTLTFACIWLAQALRRRGVVGSKLVTAVAWTFGTMGALWMLQNIFLAAALFAHRTEATTQITYWCALLKFTVIGIGFVYLLLGGLALLLRTQLRTAPAGSK